MTIENEKKYRLSAAQFEQVSEKLYKIGAILSHEDFEVNDLYAGGILEEKNAVLRIRKIAGRTLLTYKERIGNSSAIKRQIEHETEVADAQEIEKIILSLGFEKSLVYEKRRQTWHFKNAEIVLDELPFGLFMEIEGSIDEIVLAEQQLEASDYQIVHETYPNLTEKFGQKMGKTIEARFT